MKRKLAVIPAVLAIGALGASSAQADKVKECEKPYKNGWTTVFNQLSACNSNSGHEETDTANTNPGGHNPPGQQP